MLGNKNDRPKFFFHGETENKLISGNAYHHSARNLFPQFFDKDPRKKDIFLLLFVRDFAEQAMSFRSTYIRLHRDLGFLDYTLLVRVNHY